MLKVSTCGCGILVNGPHVSHGCAKRGEGEGGAGGQDCNVRLKALKISGGDEGGSNDVTHDHATAAHCSERNQVRAVVLELEADQRVVLPARLQHGDTRQVGAAEKLIIALQHEQAGRRRARQALAVGKASAVVVVRTALHAAVRQLYEHRRRSGNGGEADAITAAADVNRAATDVRARR